MKKYNEWHDRLVFWWNMHDMILGLWLWLLLWLVGFFIPYGFGLQVAACFLTALWIWADDTKANISFLIGATVMLVAFSWFINLIINLISTLL